MDCSGKNNSHGVAHGGAIFALADMTAVQLYWVRSQFKSSLSRPWNGSLVALVNRVVDLGRYSTFRVMVCDEKRIIAEFRDLAIQVNTPFLKR